MPRRAEQVFCGVVSNAVNTLFTVPSSVGVEVKYELVEVRLFNNEGLACDVVLDVRTSGGLLAHLAGVNIAAQKSAVLAGFTVFEQGQLLTSQRFNGVLDNQLHLTVTVIVVEL
jgi:hypothetical protein